MQGARWKMEEKETLGSRKVREKRPEAGRREVYTDFTLDFDFENGRL